jgi:hypothetical protein
MSFILSPNMNLNIPSVGQEPGPQYAFDVNSSLTLIDQHDHSPGRGVQINPAGININADLSFNSNNAININNLVLLSQPSSSILQSIYVKPGTETPAIQDLWYNDSAGNAVQLTFNGLVNATIASLPGESYAAGTFFWKQGAGSTTPANFDIGSITLRPNVALTANGVVLGPPSGIGSQYNINLPLLPVTTQVLTISNSGIMSTTPSLIPSNSGSQGQFLRQNSTGGTIYQNLNSNLVVVTTSYAPTAVDDLILASSSALTISLYTAVGNTGKTLTIKKTDASLANIITITPNASEKIDGASSYTLNTLNEILTIVSDGANWQIVDHVCDTAASTTTLGTVTYDNVGTPTNSFVTLQRIADSVKIQGSFKAGTPVNAAAFAIDLPSGIVIDTTKLSTIAVYAKVGSLHQISNGGSNFAGPVGGPFPLFFDGSTNNKIYCAQSGSGSSNGFAKVNASVLTAANTGVITYEFTIPVSGWSP